MKILAALFLIGLVVFIGCAIGEGSSVVIDYDSVLSVGRPASAASK